MGRCHREIQLERIDSLAELVRFAPEWDRVQRRCTGTNVLMDHRWLCAWLEIAAPDCPIHVIVLRVDGTVQGIVPLIISKGFELFPARTYHVHTALDYRYTRLPRIARWAPVRRLSFPLSVAVANRRARFLFVEQDPRLYARTVDYIESISGEWDLLVLEGFETDSQEEKMLLQAIAASGLTDDGRRFSRESLFVRIPDSMETFLRQRSHNFRRGLRRARRGNAEATADRGGVHLREFRGEAIDDGMQRIFALEKRSWKARDERRRTFHIGPSAILERFHSNVARAFARTDGALVLTMEVADRPVAGIYCLERDAVMAAIVTFRDEAFSERVTTAPMFERLIEICIGRGLEKLDLNGKTLNLEKWGDGTHRSSRFFFYNRRPYSRFLRMLSRSALAVSRVSSRMRDRGARGAEAPS